ncbi:DUF4438 family protein [Jatrophihabitans sp. YIM 134969]
MSTTLRPGAMNLVGFVEQPESSDHPYEIDVDGRPYVPTGTAGIVLGVELGDPVDALDADHVAPGVTIAHPDPAARHALTSLSCVGNPAVVRTGAAAGERGVVVGKRGEAGRVIVHFPQDVLAALRPSDQISVRAFGQGAAAPVAGVTALNADPGLLASLVTATGDAVTVGVRTCLSSQVCGNGIGRPAHAWDVDLTLGHDAPTLAILRFGDLVVVDDLDARTNLGYRSGWCTVGVVVHGPSPRPGHGPGFLPLLSGPADLLRAEVDPDHEGISTSRLASPTGVSPERM